MSGALAGPGRGTSGGPGGTCPPICAHGRGSCCCTLCCAPCCSCPGSSQCHIHPIVGLHHAPYTPSSGMHMVLHSSQGSGSQSTEVATPPPCIDGRAAHDPRLLTVPPPRLARVPLTPAPAPACSLLPPSPQGLNLPYPQALSLLSPTFPHRLTCFA